MAGWRHRGRRRRSRRVARALGPTSSRDTYVRHMRQVVPKGSASVRGISDVSNRRQLLLLLGMVAVLMVLVLVKVLVSGWALRV